ncbi:5-hydroxytryptamine receptor 2B-like [Ptychodera flava]|uniref:5-hydroxytryptamine receptor 2B-like n=1 Tax=Ptychodera flava TaxID=63121 RepID=UPI00396A5AF7
MSENTSNVSICFVPGKPNWAALPLGLLVLWILFGNTLVLLAVYREKNLKSMSNYVIASLATADLLLALLVIPLALIYLIRGYWGMGHVLCVCYLTLDVMLCTASILHLCAIAVNRYLAVTFPLRYSRDRATSRQRIIATIVPVWAVSVAIALPLFINGFAAPSNVIRENGMACGFFDYTFVIYSSMGSFFIPLLVMIVVDIRSVNLLRGRKQDIRAAMPNLTSLHDSYSDTQSSEKDETSALNLRNASPRRSVRLSLMSASVGGRRSRGNSYGGVSTELVTMELHRSAGSKEKRAAKTLVIVFICFVSLWLPFFCINITIGFCPHCNIPSSVFLVFTWLGYVSSGINPCIYTLFNKDFRHSFYRILTCHKKSTPGSGKSTESSGAYSAMRPITNSTKP